MAVARANRIVYSKAFGSADLEQNVPLRIDSVHRLASLSKLVTATIIMDLVQTNRLSLDTLVRTWLPELGPAYRKVTIRHLLTHQAGVRGYRDTEEVFSSIHYTTSREALKAFAADPLLFEPGTRVEYSTSGFTLLGAVAEAVVGKPFQDLSRDFFRRYGIQGFDIDDARALVPRRVRGYFVDAEGRPHNPRFYDASNKYPAGGFTASAEDTLRFAIAVGTGHLLKPAILDLTWTAQTTALGEKTPFGLGWGVAERNGLKMVGFNGLQPMSETSLRYFPATGDGVALFCNAEGARGLTELLEAVTAILGAGRK
jgi:CubicO group peptidase (beta-lactamase class C family)